MNGLSLTTTVSQHGLNQISEADIADICEIEQLQYRCPLAEREIRRHLVSCSTVAFLLRGANGIAAYAILAIDSQTSNMIGYGVHPSADRDACDRKLWTEIDSVVGDYEVTCSRSIMSDL